MLSYEVITALQLLRIMHTADDAGFTVTELKEVSRLHGSSVSRVLRMLRKHQWVVSITHNRYNVAENITSKTLYDLVMDMDGRVRLGKDIYWEPWGPVGREMPQAKKISEELREDTSRRLRSSKIEYLLSDAVTAVGKTRSRMTDCRCGCGCAE